MPTSPCRSRPVRWRKRRLRCLHCASTCTFFPRVPCITRYLVIYITGRSKQFDNGIDDPWRIGRIGRIGRICASARRSRRSCCLRSTARSGSTAASRGCITGCSNRTSTPAEQAGVNRRRMTMNQLLTPMRMTSLDRRHFLAALGAGLIATPRAFAGPSTERISERLAQTQQDGRVGGLHALLVSQGGKLVFEHYGKGDDEAEGQGLLRNVAFAPDVPHDLRSVSKSVVGLVYGIALAAGKVPPPEAKLYEQFPDHADLAREPG